MGGLCCPPSGENRVTAAGMWMLTPDRDEGRAVHTCHGTRARPAGPCLGRRKPRVTQLGQGRAGIWANVPGPPLTTAVDRQRDRRSREAGGTSWPRGPGRGRTCRLSSVSSGNKALAHPLPTLRKPEDHTWGHAPGCQKPNPRGRKTSHKKSH